MTPKEQLERAVTLAGGQSQMASRLGGSAKPAHVWNWLNRDNQLPGEHVISVSRAVDWQVTPHELRPDLYPHEQDGLPRESAA